ncbi:MAG TPA: DUF222 domain-containing protein [Trebonia sp.]
MDESEWARPGSPAYSPPTDPPAPSPSPLPADSAAPGPPASPPPANSPAYPASAKPPDFDPDWAEYVAQVDRETAADDDGDLEHWAPWDKPADPVESRDSWWARFGQGDEADALPPGQLLVGLTETATRDVDRLSDDELVGVLQATRRQIAREQYKQVLVIAEFGRRRQVTFEDASRRGLPVGCRPGGFPGEELAMELVTSRLDAGHRIDDAIDLTTRLPMTLAGMAAGMIDEARAGWIAMYTRALTPADAAQADEILAAAAPELRVDQVARKAAALELKFAPEAVKARRERAKRNDQRVEARRELSGNASLSGREMDTADAMASTAYIDAIAVKLRGGGLAGSLGALRLLAMADLTQGRNPLDRLMRPGPDSRHERGADDADSRRADGPAEFARNGNPVPMPALINLIVPAGTLLGWSSAPAEAGAWGLLDRDETRTIVNAATGHPSTRWCVTLTAPDGTAVAHACARGRHQLLLSDLAPQPPPAQLAELLRRLNLTFTRVANRTCDHAEAEVHYTPSRKLKHLVRARTATCDAPGCQAQALNTDLDHTIPWPDGPTDQCNLAPRCRTHHRAKQAPDWKAEQRAPGITVWTLPSGRTHTTTPTRYDT